MSLRETDSLVRPFAECVMPEPRFARLSRIHGFAPDIPQLAVAVPHARRWPPRLEHLEGITLIGMLLVSQN
jgi:hypothetical protein